MKEKVIRAILFIFITVCVAFSFLTTTSCVKEENFLTDGNLTLKFSVDTLMFDTVFTTMGSTTKQVKVYNTYNKPVKISTVTLKNGSASRFRLNVDGDASLIAHDVEIAAHDSIFIFVRVNINPNAQSNPFLVEDAIVFTINNSDSYLPLSAYGRNAVYHYPDHVISGSDGSQYRYSVIDCSKQWDASIPHVIFGYAVVDEDSVLSIQPGAEIYFANDACLWVYEGGTLQVNGDVARPVLFTSIRKDGHYRDMPGQWQGIWLATGSKNNIMEGAVVQNGTIGLLVDTVVTNQPTLRIRNTIVENMSVAGIYGQGSHIEGDNLLVHNCGMATLALTLGGRYQFSNSTFANYWSYDTRKSGGVLLNNWYRAANGTIQLRPLLQADFANCIIYGSLEEELVFDNSEGALFNYTFTNCLLRTKRTQDANMQHTLFNRDPKFKNSGKGNYHLSVDSPARGAGNYNYISIYSDLENVPRPNPPSIGAYEYTESEKQRKK